ncbi:G-type lectin S-receptor-like serine/threonine-protein kinase SRK [Morella rubra]|uniref:G-type lectin S-receptor-like serine/threonine-protein kinase SRK n=1 Tax=Morella rubra TaxID=262757 RepID=A0A6A1V281_9ROSI|nr:G-type lectin S-receptor-like serine/threonine-protein kinase SRK [Morella rubra]
MAAILPFLLLSAIFTVEAQLAGNSIVRPGSLLRPSTPSTNSTWLSRSGLYAFGFYKKGDGYALGIFIAGIPQKIVVWTANRDDPPLSVDVMLNFTGDGRLVLQSAQGTQPISSFADGVVSASASMLDSGNFVLYGSDNVTELWRSFDHPTDTILATQTLSVPPSIFRAIMQENGWLAMYPVDTLRTIKYGYSGQGKDGEGTDLEAAILKEWAYQCFERGELAKLLVNDEHVDHKELGWIVKVALWCILEEPSLHPSMKKVLLMLEEAIDIPIPPSPTSFLSTL